MKTKKNSKPTAPETINNAAIAETVRAVLAGMGRNEDPNHDSQGRWEKQRESRPVRADREVPIALPDGCKAIAVLYSKPNGEWLVKGFRDFKYPDPLPLPDGVPATGPDGSASREAKEFCWNNYWRKWLFELPGKPLPAIYAEANQRAVSELTV